MSYADVATARADATVMARVELALQKKAAVIIAALVDSSDQRQRTLCQRIYSDAGVPAPYAEMVLLMLDINGVLATRTDAQMDTAIDQLWARMIALVA